MAKSNAKITITSIQIEQYFMHFCADCDQAQESTDRMLECSKCGLEMENIGYGEKLE